MSDNGICIQYMTTDILLEKRKFPTTNSKSPKEYAFYKKFNAEKEREVENRRAESEEKKQKSKLSQYL